ncbi:hypothetical protein Nepgr_024690 [Nepenthes gracilis]|uniref:Uncharacterized protein n=1 Tax=Nepenthes gracilis TaxID=150966 RepID=A0AAD3T6E6_NEPGR|nr:hypothetical protein Nepgr_024690 [Nepenthes gracilis]
MNNRPRKIKFAGQQVDRPQEETNIAESGLLLHTGKNSHTSTKVQSGQGVQQAIPIKQDKIAKPARAQQSGLFRQNQPVPLTVATATANTVVPALAPSMPREIEAIPASASFVDSASSRFQSDEAQ